MKYHSLFLAVVLLLATAGLVQAQNESLATPVTRTFALKNANIVQKPGQVIERGIVIVKDGLIQAVGKDVKIPVDAQVIDADSMYVYAGFIDGLSHTGVPRPEANQGRGQGGAQRGGQQQQQIDRGNPSNEEAGITPEKPVKDVLKADDKSIEEMRKAGFTAAHVVPRGNMLPGTGAIVLLNSKSADAMILKDQTSFFSQLEGAGRVYPSTVIAVMSKYRELYKRAEQAKAHEAMYAKNPAGMERPNYDRALQAFYPVIDKKLPVFFAAGDLKSIYRVMNLQNDLKFPLVLANVKHGWEVTDMIKSKNVPVFLALELPKDKKKTTTEETKVKQDKPAGQPTADVAEAEKPAAKKEEKQKEKSVTDVEIEVLEKRRMEEIKKYYEQAGVYEKKGIEFGFATVDVRSNDIQGNLRKMIENGLSENTALAALTTTPAKMLGVSNILGTVEKGKIANLVVTDKPYFAEKSNVRYVFVDGQMYEYEVSTRKAGDPNANAKPAGKWSYSVNVPGQAATGGILEINANGGQISGTMTNSQTNQSTPISNPVLSGNALSFSTTISMGPQPVTLDFNLIIDGDIFDGSVSVGEFGTFDVEGSRLPNNN